MARLLRWLFVFLLLAGAAHALWWRLKPQPVEVTVAKVERGTVERLVANTRAGTIKARRQADLSPGIGGQISQLPVTKGDRVEEGQLLVEIWNTDLHAQMELVRSQVKTVQARAASLKEQAALAEREVARLKPLFAAGVVAEAALDTAQSLAKSRRAEFQAAQLEATSTEEQLGVLMANRERTRLLAPFAGIVAEINGELNEYVTPSPPGIPTPPTVVLLDTSSFYVSAPIDEVDAGLLRLGQECRISLDAFAERHFPGTVRRIDAYVLDREKQARTVQVEVDFAHPQEAADMLAGYSADVEIVIDRKSDVPRIPSQALLDRGRVLVFDPADRRLHEKTIRPGLANWEVTEVVSGLEEGEQVVLSTDRPGVKDLAPAKDVPPAP